MFKSGKNVERQERKKEKNIEEDLKMDNPEENIIELVDIVEEPGAPSGPSKISRNSTEFKEDETDRHQEKPSPDINDKRSEKPDSKGNSNIEKTRPLHQELPESKPVYDKGRVFNQKLPLSEIPPGENPCSEENYIDVIIENLKPQVYDIVTQLVKEELPEITEKIIMNKIKKVKKYLLED